MSPHDSPFCLVQNMVSAPRQPLASGSFYSPSEYMGPLCALRLLPELVRHVSAPLRFASPRTSDRTSTLPLPRPTHRPLLFRRALRGSTPARYGTDLGNVHPPPSPFVRGPSYAGPKKHSTERPSTAFQVSETLGSTYHVPFM